MITPENFTRINNDTYGNPRFVCHFLQFVTDRDTQGITELYNIALKRARKIGGRKFHNKQYGGGIAFVSYAIDSQCNAINKLMAEYQ